MARTKLTHGRVTTFTCTPGKGSDFLWDTATQGLGVKASSGGRKVFVFQGKCGSKDIRITIGPVSAWTLDRAKEEARRLHTLMDQGIDPRIEKRERIADGEAKQDELRRQDMSVAQAWDAYLNAKKHKWSERHLQDHQHIASLGGIPRKRGSGKTEAGPLAALMELRLNDITPITAEAWLREETARRPTYAALAYRLLRAFIRWAASHPDYAGIAHTESVSSGMVKDHVQRVKAKEGDSLQREQLPLWFDAIRNLPNPVQAAYLQGLLLTGARREELAGLAWNDVDFQWNSIAIHDKVEGERVIPLTPYMATLLSNLPRRNAWVFSSPSAASGRIQEPRIAHIKALTAAGLPHISIHGLRRSFGTLAEWVEAPTGVVAQIMGHKPSAIAEKHYRRRPLDLLRMWHTRIEIWILEQAGIEQPVEVQQGLRLVKSNVSS